ncbi:hypothetical protein FRC01_005198 [Tulasnella sp. 417]|nr:hypothetical protein FRC01_005198 [Tulasnella sp. 417]
MPFGLRNGPSVFQRVMQNVLAPYLWMFALVYIDDIIIYSRTFEEHLKHLDAVLGAIAKANLTLAPAKCHLAYQSLLLLGQKVSRLGMSTHKEKISAILDLDIPKNMNELRTFLGMVVYFSGYIPFYAWIVAPLFALLKKGVKWEWGEMEQRAFELTKESLVNAPIRAYAMPGNGFRLYTDACDEGLAGILQQIQPIQVKALKGTKVYEKLKKAFDEKKPVPKLVSEFVKDHEDPLPETQWADELGETTVYVERVIAYWSRILKSAERNYSLTEREALALKESLIKFQPYIEGEKLVAITDHAALTWSKTYQNVNRRLLTWGTVFAAYPDMRIVHRAGRVHSNVDSISRLRRWTPKQDGPLIDGSKALALDAKEDPLDQLYNEITPGYEERVLRLMKELADKSKGPKLRDQIEEYEVTASPEISVSVNSVKTFSTTIAIHKQELESFRDGYKKDTHYSKVLKDLVPEENWRNPRRPQYYTEDGLIYFSDWEGRGRLCVPKSKRVEIMQEMHESISQSAHQGFAKTYNRIASVYYWPRMSWDIKLFVRTCDLCQKSNARRHAPYGYLRSIPIPSQPFEVVTMDFIMDLPESGGYNAVLTIVDKLSKLALFVPTTSGVSDEDTARLFFEKVWGLFGLTRQIITDRDSRWAQTFGKN